MEDGEWTIAFGDYDEQTVLDEYVDEYSDDHTSCAIIRSDGSQKAIEAAIKNLNQGWHSATHSPSPTRH
jgi:hypothetical protein